MKTKLVDDTIKKVEQLVPEDPVRRGILEILADLIMSRPGRVEHNAKRLKKRTDLLKY